jgi:hypothetical protein
MKATQKLHDLGQSLWLDNITRDLLTTGMLYPGSRAWSVYPAPRALSTDQAGRI